MKLKKLMSLLPFSVLTALPIITSCSDNNTTINSDYKIAVNLKNNKSLGYQIADAVQYKSKQQIEVVDGSTTTNEHEIVLDNTRDEIINLEQNLNKDEYQLKYVDGKLLIAGNTGIARTKAVDVLLSNYLTKDGLEIPKTLNLKGKCESKDKIYEILTYTKGGPENDELRDPFIYQENGTYYMVATASNEGVGDDWWHLWKATKDFKDPTNEWVDLGYVIDQYTVTEGEVISDNNHWAPELYKYNNKYYIITTTEIDNQHSAYPGRGCAVFESDTLVDRSGKASKFKRISYHDEDGTKVFGRITEPTRNYIDGHLFVENNVPYMVYVGEHVSAPEGDGQMCAARMSDDLTHFVDEPVVLFTATQAPWVVRPSDGFVTDGPFIYKLSSGKLLMLWSSYYVEDGSYCMGYATADSVLGPWTQHERLIYEQSMLSGYESPVPNFSLEGGHGMLFNDT